MRLMLMLTMTAALAGFVPPPPVPAVGAAWPVGTRPPIVRGWAPPATEYGAGHRGVDLAAPVGSPVRAVARGRVSFAGRVAGRGVVAVELSGTGDPPLRTTYEPVTPSVKKGARVAPGEVLGALEPPTNHCGPTSCLHWGLLRGDTYLDPLSLLPPRLLRRGPSRLLPVPPAAAAPGQVPPGADPPLLVPPRADPPLLVPLLPVRSGVGAGTALDTAPGPVPSLPAPPPPPGLAPRISR
jgi:hypothetical protein